jgi:hypothetical protein
MDETSVTQFPDHATLRRIRVLKENLIDLSVALDEARDELLPRLEWLSDEQNADPEIDLLVAQHDRLAALLEQTQRELAALVAEGRAA